MSKQTSGPAKDNDAGTWKNSRAFIHNHGGPTATVSLTRVLALDVTGTQEIVEIRRAASSVLNSNKAV